MYDWAGIALALRGAREDRMQSRLPTYLHPLAGRILAWHVLRALSSVEPPPRQLFLVSAGRLDPAVLSGLSVTIVRADPPGDWETGLAAKLEPDVRKMLFVDAAAAALSTSLGQLHAGPTGCVLRNRSGEALAVWLDAAAIPDWRPVGRTLEALADGCMTAAAADPVEVFAVRSRADLARAGTLVRDRIVAGLMAGGVTFLLPESVLVDVDVTVGPDTVVYPGVVLEGTTVIGSETVVGPCCRIIDSRVGSGVELKGWNYLVGTTIRNRAVLEPYVRRGYD